MFQCVYSLKQSASFPCEKMLSTPWEIMLSTKCKAFCLSSTLNYKEFKTENLPCCRLFGRNLQRYVQNCEVDTSLMFFDFF